MLSSVLVCRKCETSSRPFYVDESLLNYRFLIETVCRSSWICTYCKEIEIMRSRYPCTTMLAR